jgi:hypothetical protein
MYTRKPTSGIMVNAGIFVNIANPKNVPESKISGSFGLLFLFLSLEFLVYTANNIDDKIKVI